MVYFVSVLKYVTDLPNTCRALPLAWREGYVLGDEINATIMGIMSFQLTI